MKKCSHCHSLKPLTDFNFRNVKTGRRQARCKICTRRDIMKAYYKNRKPYLTYRSKRNKLLRKIAIKYQYDYLLRHPCVDCGINEPVVLQFDHVRGVKRANVSEIVSQGFTLHTIKLEIAKCEVRCANCHIRKQPVSMDITQH